MQEQVDVELRDISINYHNIVLETKVAMLAIVSEFFKHRLKDYSDEFKRRAVQIKLLQYVSLIDLKLYDVTLNSSTLDKGNSVLNNAGTNFGCYDKKKHLRFYVHDLKVSTGASEEGNSNTITFCLIRSNVPEKEHSLNINGMNYLEFEHKMREIFDLNASIPLKYKNMRDNGFINFSEKGPNPINIINQLRISKIGVYPVFEAGK